MKQLVFDIGGTYIKYAYFVDDKVKMGSFPVINEEGVEDVPGALVNFLKNYEVDEIGVSMPGPSDLKTGTSLMTFKLPSLYQKSLKQLFNSIFPRAKVLFIHDAVAFALGALAETPYLRDKKLVVVMLGTGLGYAYIDHGRILVDKNEITTPDLGRSMYLDTNKHVEDFASASALIRLAHEAGYDFKYVKEMAEAAKEDMKVRDLFFQVGKSLGEVMNEHQKRYPFSCLMIGGGVSNAWSLLQPGFEAASSIPYLTIHDSTMCPINGVRVALALGKSDIYLKHQ